VTVFLHPVQPYDFQLLLALLRRYPAQSVFQVDAHRYYRVLQAGDAAALVRVQMIQSADSDTQVETQHVLRGDVLARSHPATEQPPGTLSEMLQRVLATDTDLHDFYTFAEQHPLLWQTIQPVRGLPLFRTETLYEALMFSIIEQHISWVAANRAQRWFVQTFGASLSAEERTFYAMPQPDTIAALTVDDLKPMKITFRRMQQLIDLSGAIADGTIDAAAWMQMAPQAMYRELLQLYGVGHWTAANVVHRARGVYPYVLHTDVALQRATAHYFHVDKSADATRELFRRYEPYAGLAAHLVLMRYVLDVYDPPDTA
jgi:DNA-3-methyladenine glycosylase II